MLYNLTILLPCVTCLIGAIWLICKRKSNTKAQNILIFCFVFSSIFFLCAANYSLGGDHYTDYVDYVWWDATDSLFSLLAIPTMYLYFRSLMYVGRFTWKEYAWFVPALVVGVGTSVLYLAMDRVEMVGYVKSVLLNTTSTADHNYSETIYKLHRFVSIDLYYFVALTQILGFRVCAVVNLRNYHRRLREFYSEMGNKSVDIDYKIFIYSILNIPFALGIIVFKDLFWVQSQLLYSIYFVVWAIIYFALFYYGSQNRYTAENFAEDLQQADIDEKNQFVETIHLEQESEAENRSQRSKYKNLSSLLVKLIDEDKIYLKSNLRLDEVAHLLLTNRVYVSRVIKEDYNCSFSDYINHKRIEFSIQLMRSQPLLTQDLIAVQSGFINAQSFSRTFKQEKGMPPKEWLKNNVQTTV